MQVQKGQWTKNCGTKIGRDSQPLGDGDPKCKCKKVSGTKTVEQKWQNKNGVTKIIHYSESPKQKLVGTVQMQKGPSETKIAEQKLVSASAKRSAEQK